MRTGAPNTYISLSLYLSLPDSTTKYPMKAKGKLCLANYTIKHLHTLITSFRQNGFQVMGQLRVCNYVAEAKSHTRVKMGDLCDLRTSRLRESFQEGHGFTFTMELAQSLDFVDDRSDVRHYELRAHRPTRARAYIAD